MCEGIDAKRCVIKEDGASEEAHHEPTPSGNEEAESSDHDRWQNLKICAATSTPDMTQNLKLSGRPSRRRQPFTSALRSTETV